MKGQGFHFGGAKARELARRLEECRRNPAYARRLFGLPTKRRRMR